MQLRVPLRASAIFRPILLCCGSTKEDSFETAKVYVQTGATSDGRNQSTSPTNPRGGPEHGGQRATRKAPESNRNRGLRGHSPFLQACLPGAILSSVQPRHRGANRQ
jgi:hypothetical protein